MITLVAQMKIQPGKGAEFEAVFARIAAKVKEAEPDTVLYKLTRSQASPDDYTVIEFYRTPEALALHLANLKTEPLMAEVGAFLAGAPEMTVLDDVTAA